MTLRNFVPRETIRQARDAATFRLTSGHTLCSIHVECDRLSPHDIGTEAQTAARTTRRNFICWKPIRRARVFTKTFCAKNVAMQLDNVLAPRAFVQAVNVLCDECKFFRALF